MKIIDSNDNVFSCKVGSNLVGIRLKKVYLWSEELNEVDNWYEYQSFLESKFIGEVSIKVNSRFKDLAQ